MRIKNMAKLFLIITGALALSGCGASAGGARVPESETPPSQMSESDRGTTAAHEKGRDGAEIQENNNFTTPDDADSQHLGGTANDTYVTTHGALHVSNGQLVDKDNSPVQLYGMSTHGLAWFPQYVNYNAFRTLRDDWNTNCVRLAMYTAEYGGYCTGGDREELKRLVKNGVEYATDLGMYVIIDWHILSDQDPNVYKEDALAFFEEMSAEYADHDNVIYEICNEPNGYATWDSVKAYAGEVIPVIRANDSDAVILVGSPTWSQDIDKAAADSLNFDNILYTLHFYAGTHKDDLRSRLESCAENGLPVFVSEFGMCDASGNGANDFDSATQWMELLDCYSISYMCWNLANKDESSSVFLSGNEKVSDWTAEDLSEAGNWIREHFRSK